MENPMMKCGHRANSVVKDKDGNERLACVICAGIVDGAYEIDNSPPSLKGRVAKCCYKGSCRNTKPSDSKGLAFFKHNPDSEFDEYYCGCRGWN